MTIAQTQAPAPPRNADVPILLGTLVIVLIALVWAWRVGLAANRMEHAVFHVRMDLMDTRTDIKNMRKLIK